MLISRNQFFLILLFLVVMLALVPRLIWLFNSERITGEVSFTGKSQAGQFMHTYAVVQFRYNDSLFLFNGPDNLLFEDDTPVPVRFNPDQPAEARIDQFVSIWGDRLLYAGIPIVLLLIIFFQPDIFPYVIRLQKSHPLISLIENRSFIS